MMDGLDLVILEGLEAPGLEGDLEWNPFKALKKIKINLIPPKPVREAVQKLIGQETEKITRAGKAAAEAAQETFKREYKGQTGATVNTGKVESQDQNLLMWVLIGAALIFLLRN